MRLVYVAAVAAFLMTSLSLDMKAGGVYSNQQDEEFRFTLKLFDSGMYGYSRDRFNEISNKARATDPEGYSVLCDLRACVPGAEFRMNEYISRNPHSVLVFQLKWQYALNLFNAQDYRNASEIMEEISPKHLYKSQQVEYLFRKAYCDLEMRDMASARENFTAVEQRGFSDYTAPSRYALGYIAYLDKDFNGAIDWFTKSAKDSRFKEMSSYYIMESHFMLGNHDYVTSQGDQVYEIVPEERKPHLARIISESWLVLGDAENARKYYDLNAKAGGQPSSRADWFYTGSVLYAVEDYRGAIDAFSMMGEKKDSIGQIANYQLAYSYIQVKNKVAAMDAFRDASALYFDEKIAEDAFFNWAKLAFDLNNDTSVFYDYLDRYSELERGDRINSYIAVAALHNRDYEGALNAYDQIDELDDDMRGNYMKANYLRAEQLIRNGSYRKAIPCLKAAAYYSERNSRFNQLVRFWMAESYYRNDQYVEAKDIFTDLYNTSALYGRAESYQISYNIAYCYFKQSQYTTASKWFDEYLGETTVRYRKDALERRADCYFMTQKYDEAAAAYDQVLKDYFSVNDVYPYYQSAVSHGLAGDVNRKIELLSNVLEASPSAKLYPDALYELGRTYAVKEDDDNALKCFTTLTETVKDSGYVAKTYIEMGSLARNQSQFNEALDYYKIVVEQMPNSGYAENALAAIESIYQTKNEPEEYIAYIEGIGKGASKTADEKEDMIFNSAEQIFLSGNYERALVSLQSYGEKYPDGRYGYKAEFYMAESYRSLGKAEHACDCYKKVIENGEGSFVELSMLHFADLSYKLERWEDAFGGYSSLSSAALLDNNKFLAVVGMMRSAYKGHRWSDAIENADKLMYDTRTEKTLAVEAEYIKAKSYLATSRRTEAFAILEKLAKDVTGVYGAEAAYMVILDCYDRGEFTAVEEKVYAFSDAGSNQMYWLAKSFIVLGDSFAERDELEQAKATFESVKDAYEPSGAGDDVMDNVQMRLRKLEEMMSGN